MSLLLHLLILLRCRRCPINPHSPSTIHDLGNLFPASTSSRRLCTTPAESTTTIARDRRCVPTEADRRDTGNRKEVAFCEIMGALNRWRVMHCLLPIPPPSTDPALTQSWRNSLRNPHCPSRRPENPPPIHLLPATPRGLAIRAGPASYRNHAASPKFAPARARDVPDPVRSATHGGLARVV